MENTQSMEEGQTISITTCGLPRTQRTLKYRFVFLFLVTFVFLGLIYPKVLPDSVLRMVMNGSTTFVEDLRNLTAEMEQLRVEVAREEARRINKTFNDYGKMFHVPNVSCSNMFAGAKFDIDKGVELATKMKSDVPLKINQYYINETQNCAKFIQNRGYITSHLTKEEREFPIAFSILVYKDAEMVDRLLRAIYRPQNIYCIHVDVKANVKFMEAMTSISKCFPNVFLAHRRISVVWGEYSVLEPEIICMNELWSRSKKWKYFINLTGQEFPLKTNAQLVQILKAFEGANDIEGTVQRANKERWKDTQPPLGIRPLKGSVHITVNRKFVDYLLHNTTAIKLLDWIKTTDIPDETFFTTLNHNPQLKVPGSYTGWPETDNKIKPFLSRYKNWGHPPHQYPCAGYWTRGICIVSTGDLPVLRDRPELFANKFHLKEDRIVVGCLEERHFNLTRDQYYGMKTFNTSFYQNLDAVKNKVPVWTTDEEKRNNILHRPLL